MFQTGGHLRVIISYIYMCLVFKFYWDLIHIQQNALIFSVALINFHLFKQQYNNHPAQDFHHPPKSPLYPFVDNYPKPLPYITTDLILVTLD